MAKQLVFSEDARRGLKRGIDVLATAVVTTLGPKGRNVALDKKFGAPTITHDGVTVAKEIELEDPFENMGAQLLKEAATKTNDIAGDGTTTATLLAHTVMTEGMKNVAAGANPMLIKRGILAGTEALVKAFKLSFSKAETLKRTAASSKYARQIFQAMRPIFADLVQELQRKSSAPSGPSSRQDTSGFVRYWVGMFISLPCCNRSGYSGSRTLPNDHSIAWGAKMGPAYAS